MHDGYKNRYYFVMNTRKFVLAIRKPLQAYEDHMQIERECKMREKQKCEEEKIEEKERMEGKEERRVDK